MKIEEHRSLWNAIQQFPLDDPNAEISFSRKLSAKQNWSPTFTERVVEEYRKFLFLCCISPNGASPSQAVDEAWHLHLTYTRSYWIDLCKDTLGKDIHHHPSRGGDEEDHKHRDWYAATLVLYQSVFESPPPDEIWPPPLKEEATLPEPPMVIQRNTFALVVMLLLLPFVISAYHYLVLFPFSLTGPEFLGFFPLLAISCIICYVIIQKEKYHSFPQLAATWFPENATLFEYTLFLYGTKRVIQTAIVDLVRRNLLEVTSDGSLMVNNNRFFKNADDDNPLFNGLLQEEQQIVTYDRIATGWYRQKPPHLAILQQLHELANSKGPLFKRNYLLLLPFVAGIARIIQGMVNHKPVSFLVIEMVIVLIVALLVRKKFSRRALMNKNIRESGEIRQYAGLLYEDQVVSDFATRGYEAIARFSDGLILVGIFGTSPFIDRVRETIGNLIADLSVNTSGNSGDGGGCGSGGGGCGGGCGSGCGGCGGD